MTINVTQKGNRQVLKVIKRLTAEGWLVEKVEKTGKFIKVKDLFSLWDVMAIKKSRTKLIQVKSNRKPVLKKFEEFKESFPQFECEIWIWEDRKGFRIIEIK